MASLRRAPLPHQLLVPRRGVGARRAGRAGGELGLTGLAVTDHRASTASSGSPRRHEEAGLHPVIGTEIELLDAIVAGPGSGRRARAGDRRPARRPAPDGDGAGRRIADRMPRGPAGPAAPGAGPPARSSRAGQGGSARDRRARSAVRISSCSPATRPAIGACAGSSRGRIWPGRRRCRASARRCSPSTPRASSRCRAVARGRSPAGCGSAIGRARAAAERTRAFGGRRPAGERLLSSSCRITSCPTTTGSWRETAALADELGPAGRRHERRPLRPAGGPRVPGRPDGDPPRPDARDARPTCAGRTASRT